MITVAETWRGFAANLVECPAVDHGDLSSLITVVGRAAASSGNRPTASTVIFNQLHIGITGDRSTG